MARASLQTSPGDDEQQRIQSAMNCLEVLSRAMDGRCRSLVAESRTLTIASLSNAHPGPHDWLVADALVISRVYDGIVAKLMIGARKDELDALVGETPGLGMAYPLGQMLVYRNEEIQRSWFYRLTGRTGPLEPNKLVVVLRAASQAFGAWIKRDTDKTHMGDLSASTSAL